MARRLRNRVFGARIAVAAAALLLLGSAGLVGASPAAALPGESGAAAAHAAAPVADAAAAQTPRHAADLDNFVIGSFEGEYRLGIDETGRSTLRTTEHIVAVFPEFDQNRGFIRDLVRVYDRHETELQVLGVTDENGDPREYWVEPYGDFLSVTMAVPEGSYVHGEQHYVIEYTQRDVTRHFEDTGADEFYWDINGTGWRQPFGIVTAHVVLDDTVADAFNGAAACYRGKFGESTPCEISGSDSGFTAQTIGLDIEENMSIALGFEPGTFAAAPTPPVPFLQRVPLLIWSGIASALAAIATFVISLVRGRSAKTGRAIIAQYEPPEGVNAATAAELLHQRGKGMTATLLDLAVRRKVRLLRDEPNDRYGMQAIAADGLDPTEGWVYGRLFGSTRDAAGVEPGAQVWFTKQSTTLGDTSRALTTRIKASVKKQGLVKPISGGTIATVIVLMLLGLALPVIHSIVFGQFTLMTILLAVGINALIWILIGMIAALVAGRRVTHEGALLIDHLKGLREYIRLAEADRIRMLQSVSGAEVDEQFIVHVYERLLPYAVIFGFENEWQGELEKYYRESTPDWISGTGSEPVSFRRNFAIASFAHEVSSSPITQTASSGGSGSGSSFSSFSGGSSGGGFSGGGGGGGGGRGI